MEQKNHLTISQSDSTVHPYEQALLKLLEVGRQQKGAVLDNITYKVFHWNDDSDPKRKTPRLRYQAYVKVPGRNKPIRRNFEGGDAEARAWRFVLDTIDRYRNGESLVLLLSPNITFKGWVDTSSERYFSSCRKSYTNVNARKSRLKKLTDFFGSMKLKDITAMTIANYFEQRKQKVTVKAVKNEVSILKKFLRLAVINKYISENPYDVFQRDLLLDLMKEESEPVKRKPKKDKRQPLDNPLEVFKSIWEVKEVRDFCLYIYYTGLRDEDILNLAPVNLKERAGILYFDLQEGKTQKNLAVPVHRALIDNNVIMHNREYLYQYRYSRDKNNAIHRLCELFKKQMVRYKLNPDITYYWFRHTFQDTLERCEVNRDVRERLMGKLPATSLKSYTHRDLVSMKEGIDRLPMINEFVLKAWGKEKSFTHSSPKTKTTVPDILSKTAIYV